MHIARLVPIFYNLKLFTKQECYNTAFGSLIIVMSEKVDTMTLEWMRDDALFLRKNGRPQGCLALLLCLVDAQAASCLPGNSGNRSRYCGYLKKRLVDLGHDESYRIEEKDRLVHLSEIVYEYFRCFLVHEGDPRDNTEYEVQLKYEPNPVSLFGTGVLIDRPREQFVVQAEWLIDLLLTVTEVNNET